VDDCGPILRIDDQMEVMPKGVKEPITIYDVGGIGGEYNLYLPEKKDVKFIELQQPLKIQFSILNEKDTRDDFHVGMVIKLATEAMELQTNIPLGKLTNLKVALFDDDKYEITGDLYAKVTQNTAESPPTFRAVFTSVPPEAKAFFKYRYNLDS